MVFGIGPYKMSFDPKVKRSKFKVTENINTTHEPLIFHIMSIFRVPQSAPTHAIQVQSVMVTSIGPYKVSSDQEVKQSKVKVTEGTHTTHEPLIFHIMSTFRVPQSASTDAIQF